VSNGNVVAPVELEVVVGQPDAVRSKDTFVEEAAFGEESRNALPVSTPQLSVLLLRLGHVDVNEEVALPRGRGYGIEALEWQRVGRVRCDAKRHAVVAAGLCVDEPQHVLQALLPRKPSGDIDHPGRKDAARARVDDGLEDGSLVHVHLASRRHAGAEQLGSGQRHAPVGVLFGQPRLAGPEDLAEEPVERDIFGGAAKQRHRGMAVDVDEPGEQDALVALFVRAVWERHPIGMSHVCDSAALDVDRAGPVDGSGAIASDDGVADQPRRGYANASHA